MTKMATFLYTIMNFESIKPNILDKISCHLRFQETYLVQVHSSRFAVVLICTLVCMMKKETNNSNCLHLPHSQSYYIFIWSLSCWQLLSLLEIKFTFKSFRKVCLAPSHRFSHLKKFKLLSHVNANFAANLLFNNNTVKCKNKLYFSF